MDNEIDNIIKECVDDWNLNELHFKKWFSLFGRNLTNGDMEAIYLIFTTPIIASMGFNLLNRDMTLFISLISIIPIYAFLIADLIITIKKYKNSMSMVVENNKATVKVWKKQSYRHLRVFIEKNNSNIKVYDNSTIDDCLNIEIEEVCNFTQYKILISNIVDGLYVNKSMAIDCFKNSEINKLPKKLVKNINDKAKSMLKEKNIEYLK